MKKYLTFDDVLLLPNYSEVLPNQVSVKTYISKKLILKIPLIASAMDTVCEHEMAISMALNGGLGVIHKNLSIEEQLEEVKMVKSFDFFNFKNPIYTSVNSKVFEVIELLDVYEISSIIVVDENQTVCNIVTKNDLKFISDTNSLISTHLNDQELIVGMNLNSLSEARELMFKNKISKLPLVDSNKKLKGIITLSDISKFEKYENMNLDSNKRLVCAAAISTTSDAIERVTKLVEAGLDCIVIDSAHANSKTVINLVKEVRKKFLDLTIIAGNIVTPDAVENLYKAGADCVKVGIGSGSICTTRIVSGVGCPQLTAVIDCVKEAKKFGLTVISDGGTRYSGDIVKALAAGSNAVMLGSLLAGHKESPGEVIKIDGKKFMSYNGMGSLSSMKKGGGERYFQSKNKKFVPEGVEGLITYKGDVYDTLYQLVGGIKAGMGYNGASNLNQLYLNANFIEISNSALKESHPHSLTSFSNSPNY